MTQPPIEIDYVLSTSDQYNAKRTNTVRSTTIVYCSFRLVGLHLWTNCPFDDVDFLKTLHRHEYHIKCYFPVTHSDRDVEFIRVKNQIMDYLTNKYWNTKYGCCNFGEMSCEMIAEELCSEFTLCQAEVSEDGENGGIVYREYI